MNKRLTRRSMLTKTSAGIAAAALVPRHVLGGPGYTAPSEKLVLASIGVGGVGFGQTQGCEQVGFDVAVLCDVDDVYAKKAFDRWPNARRYRDYREMLEVEDKKIDAVYCGTPDHSHAVIVMEALKRKKHVCCVKPLTRTVAECRKIIEAADQAGVATQVTASPNTGETGCRTCELIWGGAIGDVHEMHVWSNRPLWPQGMLRPAGRDPVPDSFDWDLWLGPAAERPFVAQWPEDHLAVDQINSGPRRNRRRSNRNRAVYHPWNFRGWWDFGTGALGDMGCHHINTPYRALKLGDPDHIHATSSCVFEETAPLASIVTYDYPARADMAPVRVVWYDGGLRPPRPKELQGIDLPQSGVLYVGTKGKMLDSRVLGPRGARTNDIPKTLPRRPGTWQEWIDACKGGETAGCNFQWAGLLTEFVLLGNIAIRTGQSLDWDAASKTFSNSDGANRLLDSKYRAGWTL